MYTLNNPLPPAEICRRNGWGVGTRLVGDEGRGPDTIVITAIGEECMLARLDANGCCEGLWTLACRDWKPVDAPPEPQEAPESATVDIPAPPWALPGDTVKVKLVAVWPKARFKLWSVALEYVLSWIPEDDDDKILTVEQWCEHVGTGDKSVAAADDLITRLGY
jgi:hypothetical protein